MRPLLLALLVSGCATRAPAPTPTKPAVAREPLTPRSLPAELTACARHTECVLAPEPLRIAETLEDCSRPAPPTTGAVNEAFFTAHRQRYFDDAFTRCPRAPELMPRAARLEPLRHAACIAAQCRAMPGGALTRDEAAEEARGDFTRAPPPLDCPSRRFVGEATDCCYLDADCPSACPVPLTAFPEGARDARGAELCPVCPRPGTPLADEAARLERLTASRAVSGLVVEGEEGPVDPPALAVPVCPALSCAPPAGQCVAQRCEGSVPTRPARKPVTVARFALPPEPVFEVELPAAPQLPREPELLCATKADCVATLPEGCSCAPWVVTNRRSPPGKRVCTRPCNQERDEAPLRAPAVACHRGVCLAADVALEVARAERERARVLPKWKAWAAAHRAWEARVRAVQADLEAQAER